MAKKLTQIEFIQKAQDLHKGRYTYENTVYVRSADKIEVTCPEHGSFYVTANNHISQSNLCGCPKCYGNKKLTFEDFVAKSRIVHNDKYDYTKAEYTNSQKHINIVCPVHGTFAQTPTRHMAGRGCQDCGGTKRVKLESLIANAAITHSGYYDYSGVTKGAKATDNVKIVCPLHGEFTQKLKLHINREYGCPKCGQRSKHEDAIADYLAQHTIVERRNKKLLSGKEIDIWLPALNIGVEFHGLYWHTYNRVGNLHRLKWRLAEKAGIRLIQIFEDEWINKRAIVEARLLAIIGKSETYNARQLELRKVGMGDIREMLEVTHIQGAGVSSINYGLFEGEKVIAVATFDTARTGAMTKTKDTDTWEVVRYASIGRVRGGFSKLFKRFIADVNPKKVISYCDLRYGNGKLYEATGFYLDGITEPDYWWIPKGKVKRVPRYVTQKHKMAKSTHPLHKYYSPDKTETQICAEAGWEKIYGVGNQKWVWKTQ